MELRWLVSCPENGDDSALSDGPMLSPELLKQGRGRQDRRPPPASAGFEGGGRAPLQPLHSSPGRPRQTSDLLRL